MKTAAQSAGLQSHCSKNLYISPDGCRGFLKLRRSIKRAQKFEEPRFLQSSVRRPSAEMSLILSRSGQESIQTSTVSVYENTTLPANLPKDVSKLEVFSGACLHRENWRLHLHVQHCSWKRRKPKVHEAQEKKNDHQRWFRFWLVNWT